MTGRVFSNYKTAFSLWRPLLASHVLTRIVIAAVIGPMVAVILAATLYFSDQSALTDQAIAGFLFTPIGAIGAVLVLCLLLAALVIDVAVATAILRSGQDEAVGAVKLAVGFLFHAALRLGPFVAHFLGRLLLIILPVLGLGGVIFWLLLTRYDINYYLTARPPEAWVAAGLIGALLIALACVLITRLSGWAVALHLTLFDAEPVSSAFAKSRDLMEGHRVDLVKRFGVWFVLRAVLLMIAGGIAAWCLSMLAESQLTILRLLALAMAGVAGLFALVNLAIGAISNGALAGVLNEDFDRGLDGRKTALGLSDLQPDSGKGKVPYLAMAAIGVVALLSIGTAGAFAENLKANVAPEIIAHRGAAAKAPENTMASVERAIADNTDWIEIDVQESAEGEIIVAHDSDFMRAAGVPTKVWDVTAQELAQIDIGSWYGSQYTGERVPRLAQVLGAAKDQARVIIELKYYGHDQDLERRVIALVEEAGMADQIAIMSLSYPAVEKMKDLRPAWRTGVLAATFVGDISGLEGDFLAINHAQLRPRAIAQAQGSRKAVYAWTVDKPAVIARMLSMGVDGLITNDPAGTRAIVAAYNQSSLAERLILRLGAFF